jgi:hypothetical protein
MIMEITSRVGPDNVGDAVFLEVSEDLGGHDKVSIYVPVVVVVSVELADD